MKALIADYPPGEQVGWHCHAQAQLMHASEGMMLVGTEQGDWAIPTGHALWVPAQVGHQVRMAGAVSMRTLLVPPGVAVALPGRCRVIEVSALLRHLILAASSADAALHPARQHHLLGLIGHELNAARQVNAHVPMPADTRLQGLCTAVLEAPGQELTLEQCGHRLNMSSRTLARLFQRELGMSFGEWRTRARMVLSAQCLVRGQSVLRVALEHGYQSPSAFATTFKRTLGYSPRECR